MNTKSIQRVSFDTGLVYNRAIAAFEDIIKAWDPAVEEQLVGAKAPWPELQAYVHGLAGSLGLMRFHKVDQGAITSLSGRTKECALYLVGNAETANGILDIDIRAAMYVPFRVTLFTPPDMTTATIMYDLPSSFLAQLDNPALDAPGKGLDGHMDEVVQRLMAAARA